MNEDGFREVLGAAEGMKEDKASSGAALPVAPRPRSGRREAHHHMHGNAGGRGWSAGCQIPALHGTFLPQRFSVVPKSKVRNYQECSRRSPRRRVEAQKAKAVVAELRAMKLKEAAEKDQGRHEETLTYCDFPASIGRVSATNEAAEPSSPQNPVVGTFA